jgi:hypothetical protein
MVGLFQRVSIVDGFVQFNSLFNSSVGFSCSFVALLVVCFWFPLFPLMLHCLFHSLHKPQSQVPTGKGKGL